MSLTVVDAYLAEYHGMKILADLPRPKVPFVPELISGAFCLWRTHGDGSHADIVRLDPGSHPPVTAVLREAIASPLRVRGGRLVVRAPEGARDAGDVALLDRLADSPRSTGYLMARSLDGVRDEPQPRLRDGQDARIALPRSGAEYLEARRLVSRIFSGTSKTYDPDADFYSAPETMTYVALYERNRVISAASILVVDGIANVWSVATDEDARGRGAASVVVHACLREARHQGAHAAVLGTDQELANPGGLYNRLGFETVGHDYSWTIEESALMSM